MTNQRFKELLNLYLDHRLEGAEALEFEQALCADAGRRKMLRDYSLIQGGCSELFTRSASQAPSSAALCRSLRTVEARISRANSADAGMWSWTGWTAGFGVAGLGLAACATVFIAVRGAGPGKPAETVAAIDSGAAPVVLAVAPSQDVNAPVLAAAATTVALASGEVISERQKARNLTLAALGLTAEGGLDARASQPWKDVRDAYELADLSPAARSWIAANAAAEEEWSRVQLSSFTGQTASSGQNWSAGGAGGFQVQSAGFSFGR